MSREPRFDPGPAVERLRRVVRSVHARLPRADLAVLWGWPDHEDSVLALEQALQRTSVRRIVVLTTDRRNPPPVPTGSRTIRVDKDSVRGRLAFFAARYVFFTHRCFLRRFPPNMVSVNLWHGMPIKRVGRMLPGDDVLESSHVLATSPYWADVMDRSMVAVEGVLTTGLPRNDRLFLDPGPTRAALGLDRRDDVDHLVAWLPTYRRSVRGRITVDGVDTESPFEFPVDVDVLEAHLARHRAFAVVKVHPMAPFSAPVVRDHLLVVDDGWFQDHGVSLYEFLGATDALISDVSSVAVDYLVLDRPVIHAMGDLEEYRASRGFSMDDVDEVLAGPVVTTLDELLDALDASLTGDDPGAAARRAARERSHTHTDAGATDRLLTAIGLPPAGELPERVHYGPDPHDEFPLR